MLCKKRLCKKSACTMTFSSLWLLLFCLSPIHETYADTGMTEAELERWFNKDDSFPVQVDEGQLVFLSAKPEKPVLHAITELTIKQQSIISSWVNLSQCYKHLDPVASTAVVYQYQSMKNLRILSTQNIGSANVVNQTIELENVLPDAQLCIAAEVKIFNRLSDNTFSLVNGPYHRKFLDGYFPYHISLSIHYPESKLKIIGTSPAPQSGFQVKSDENKIMFDSVFAGKLTIEAIFEQR